jgi:Arc/MetJ-type ribon-helix-helix transcriptional regulator
MASVKIAVTIREELIAEIDRLVSESQFPNRSRAVQSAIEEKLARLDRGRLARECAKLDPKFEKALADQGLLTPGDEWPEY